MKVAGGMRGTSFMAEKTSKQPVKGAAGKISPGLKGHEKFQQAIMDTMFDGLLVCDEKSNIRSVNQALCKMFGYKENELVGQNLKIIMTKKDGAEHGSHVQRFLATKKSLIMGKPDRVFSGRHKTGKLIDIEVVVNFFTENDNYYFVACIRDLSEKRKAETAQKEAEALYKMLADHGNDIIILEDKKQTVKYISPSLIRHLGINPEDVIGGNSWGRVHPDDKKKWRPRWERIVLGKKEDCISELRFRHADGQYILFECLCSPILNKKGEVTGSVAACRDITERKQAEATAKTSEERLRLITENMSDIIFLFDTDGKTLFVSPSIKHQLGWTIEDRLGKTCLSVLHPEDKPLWQVWKKGVMEKGEAFKSRARFRHKKGHYLWFDSATEPIRDEKGKVTVAVMTSRNVTVQHEAEEKLKMLAENASDIITLRDGEGKVLYITPSFEKQLGYSAEKEIGRGPWYRLVHQEDKEKTKAWRKTVFDQGNSFHVDLRLKNSKGDYLWFESHTEPIKDEKGKVVAAVTSSRNITEYKEAESESLRLGAILEDSLNEIYLIDPKTLKFKYVNKQGRTNLGYSMSELGTKTPADIGGSRSLKAVRACYGSLLSGKKNRLNIEGVHQRKDGSLYDVALRIWLFKGEGYSVFVASAEDITGKKKAESEASQLGRIVEDSLNEIYVFDSDTLKFLSVNRGARENLGYSLKKLKNMTPVDIKPEFPKEKFLKLIQPLLKGEKEQIYFETVHRRKDGTDYDVEVYLQLSKTGDKPVFVAIIEDITEKKAAQEKLQQVMKMEAVGNLSGGIAHDFNNLLTAIQGSLQLMEMIEPDLGKDARECLSIALKSTKRGAELTSKLLAFSRKQTLKPVVLDINVMIRDLLGLLKRTIDESIDIETHLLKGKALVELDEVLLQNALLNLSVNARDAMPDGGHLIFEVTRETLANSEATQRGLKPGNYVVVSISDTGGGIPEGVKEQIFEPFFSTKDLEKGTGLGLSMVYGFVKQSGGYINVYSEEGVGTTFKLYFTEVGSRPAAASPETPRINLEQKVSGTILLVEDDEGVRNFISQALRTRGYKVLDAGDGPEARKKMKTAKNIDLLLTDVVLPKGMSGIDVGKVFSEKFPGKPVIYSSGYTEKAGAKRNLLPKGEQLLSKPYDLEVLFDWVQERLSRG